MQITIDCKYIANCCVNIARHFWNTTSFSGIFPAFIYEIKIWGKQHYESARISMSGGFFLTRYALPYARLNFY
jgi:hypothetical protein